MFWMAQKAIYKDFWDKTNLASFTMTVPEAGTAATLVTTQGVGNGGPHTVIKDSTEMSFWTRRVRSLRLLIIFTEDGTKATVPAEIRDKILARAIII